MTIEISSTPLTPNQIALDGLATLQDHSTRLNELLERLAAADTPADLRTVALTRAKPVEVIDADVRSFGVLNATAVNVMAGVGGIRAQAGYRAVPVPPLSLLVLPVQADHVEVGIDPATIAADATAVVYVLLFKTVQPAHLGSVR